MESAGERDSVLSGPTDSEQESGGESGPEQGGAGGGRQVGEQAVLSSLGATGLPKEFLGDTVSREQDRADRANNNKAGVLVDRWAERFKAMYPGLQHVIKLGAEQREYLDSLTYDEQSETPAGDGRGNRHAIRHVNIPLVRLAVEGPPGIQTLGVITA